MHTDEIWSHGWLADIAPHPLTPFSWSLLASAYRRAFRRLWNDWGATTSPPEIIKRSEGRAALNLGAIEQLLAARGITPPSFPWKPSAANNGGDRSLAQRWKAFRDRQRLNSLADRLFEQASHELATVRRWWQGVLGMTWSQATLLQVMEEAEPMMDRVLYVMLAADCGLIAHPDGASSVAPCDEEEMLAGLVQASRTTDGLSEFLSAYGHRTVDEVEIAQPRWREDPSFPQAAHKALSASGCEVIDPASDGSPPLLSVRLQARTALGQAADAVRQWALAAAAEGMSDGRLIQADDVFWLRLEEVKQVLTGEWNISRRDEIHDLVARRRAEMSAVNVSSPSRPPQARPEQLLDPLRSAGFGPTSGPCALEVPTADPTWVLLLPLASRVTIAGGPPHSTVANVARRWGIPVHVASPAEASEPQEALGQGDER
ncbi:MAG: hypothetical protein Kow0047_00670 [Anaerolineae bacterium]